MTGAEVTQGLLDTAESAALVTGILTMFWLAGQVMAGKAQRKWRRVRKHRAHW